MKFSLWFGTKTTYPKYDHLFQNISYYSVPFSETPFSFGFLLMSVAYPGILFEGGGFQQIQLRTEDRENGDLGAVAH